MFPSMFLSSYCGEFDILPVALGVGVAYFVTASVLLVEIGSDRVRVTLKAPTKNWTLGRPPAQKVPK